MERDSMTASLLCILGGVQRRANVLSPTLCMNATTRSLCMTESGVVLPAPRKRWPNPGVGAVSPASPATDATLQPPRLADWQMYTHLLP